MLLEIFFNNPVSLFLADILSTKLVSSPIIVDGWSFVHFFSGFIVMFLLMKWGSKKGLGINRYWILLILLLIYEAFEWIFFLSDSTFMTQESIFNSFIFDILVGMFGGFVWDTID